MSYIAIVDYGVGNLKSVTNAMKYLGLEARITSDAGEVERAGAVILPGVGTSIVSTLSAAMPTMRGM